MEETQLFRLSGSTDIEEISCYRVGEQHAVYWGDIEQVFPGVKHVKNGRVTASLMRDSNGVWITPHCIKQYPNVVLDVVLSTAADQAHLNRSVVISSLGPAAHGADIPAIDAPADDAPLINAADDTLADDSLANTPTDALTDAQPNNALVDLSADATEDEPANVPAASFSADNMTGAPSNNISTDAPANIPDDTPNNTLPIDPAHSSADDPVDTPANAHTEHPSVQTLVELPNNNQADSSPPANNIATTNANPPSSSLLKGPGSNSAMTLAESVSTLTIVRAPSPEPLSADPNQHFQNTVIHKLDGIQDQGAKTHQLAQEILKLQKQMSDRLILIQSKTEAILNQQLELAEYPIPRLFIVLPEELTKYDPSNWFRTKFRLHFICEAGKHTEPKDNKVPHHLHLAKHEGYLIREPTEFFKKYGPFLLLMLELIKFGTSVAGHVVPTLASLKVVELVDSVKQTVETVTAKIDYSLECIDSQLAKVEASSPRDFADTESGATMTHQDLTNYLNDVEGLEGVELRQLGSFLKTSEEENLLGNLYRMTTSDGHVKWVCRDHYRTGYQEKYVQNLRDIIKMQQGVFDQQLGKITITLRSSFAANEFYNAVIKAKGILELIVELRWECTKHDLEALYEALKKSRVATLRLDLGQFGTNLGRTTLSKLRPTSRYKVLSRITELSSMKATHVVLPKDFVLLSEFHPRKPLHAHKLSFELVAGPFLAKELEPLAEALKTNSTLTTFDLQHNMIGPHEVQLLAEALKANSTMTTLHLSNNAIGDNGTQALSVALKTNLTLTTLRLDHNSIGDDGAQALSEALKVNSTLTSLDLKGNSIWFNGLLAFMEALKINPALTNLDVYGNPLGEKRAEELSEALKTSSTMTTLDLDNDSIGSDGIQRLSMALRTNSALTTLHLKNDSIGDHGAQALADALKTNSTLTTLTLLNNEIGGDGTKALAQALKRNSVLTTLYITNNLIGETGAQALAQALMTNSTLTTLNLTSNSIGDPGAQAVAEALKFNSILTILDLQSNSIGDNGALALADTLRTNSTVTTLDLRGNSINYTGITALWDALKINSTLTILDLTSNSISVNLAKAMLPAFKPNSTVASLDLVNNKIGSDGAKALADALKSNST
ncbi:hypothetical protein BGZ72_006690, partial [Mortierella alpina]